MGNRKLILLVESVLSGTLEHHILQQFQLWGQWVCFWIFQVFQTALCAPVIWNPHCPHPRHGQGKAGTITSYSPACVSLGDGVSTRFHFFVAWFSDGSKSSGGESEQMTSSHLKIRLTSLRMSRGFTLNLSVVAFSCRLVISTFNRNYLHSSHSHFLHLEMLSKV